MHAAARSTRQFLTGIDVHRSRTGWVNVDRYPSTIYKLDPGHARQRPSTPSTRVAIASLMTSTSAPNTCTIRDPSRPGGAAAEWIDVRDQPSGLAATEPVSADFAGTRPRTVERSTSRSTRLDGDLPGGAG